MRRRAWALDRGRYENRDSPCFSENRDSPYFCRMSPWASLRTVVILIYVFMLGPIVITAAVSFNQSNRSQFPPRGFSLQWWQRAFSAEWVDPLIFSLKLGLLAAPISTLLALPLAFA